MPATAVRLSSSGAGELVERIRDGDDSAWQDLVNGYSGLLIATLRGMRLSDANIRDVVQTTWLRLVQNIDRIADPSRVGGWLVTTARREALRVIAQQRWIDPLADVETIDLLDDAASDTPDRLVALEREVVVRRLIGRLSPRCQELMARLFDGPQPAYDEIARALNMPVGSIGPTRARCLQKLAAYAAEEGIDLHDLRA